MKNTTTNNRTRYQDFLNSDDTLRIYRANQLIFSSKKDKVIPLLEYIESPLSKKGPSIIYDRIIGNAAALLSIKAGAVEVFSPMGSQIGVDTLVKYNIKYHLDKIVPFIQKDNSNDMCFMEKLSTEKTPEDFYTAIKAIIK